MHPSLGRLGVASLCVGHEAALQGVCEGALDRVVEEVHEQFSALDTELLVLETGDALVEPMVNGSRLVDGNYEAQAELGQGLRSLPASFVGESL
ncbi:MAG: hypothetical protein GY811_14325 [Myxococcales bacterium]|nr:hypothetical protein [Myxococcales bacterium]